MTRCFCNYLISSAVSFEKNIFNSITQTQKRIASIAIAIIALIGSLYLALVYYRKNSVVAGKKADGVLETTLEKCNQPNHSLVPTSSVEKQPVQSTQVNSPYPQCLADVQNLQKEIESLNKMDPDSASWETECTRLGAKADSIRTTFNHAMHDNDGVDDDDTIDVIVMDDNDTIEEFHSGINQALLSTHFLLRDLGQRKRYGYRSDLTQIEANIKELEKDSDAFFALLESLKKLAQPFLGKDMSIDECLQEIPRFIQKFEELRGLSPEDPNCKKIAQELSVEMHICREHWQLKLQDEDSECPEFEIFKVCTFLVNGIANTNTDLVDKALPGNLTDWTHDCQDATVQAQHVTANQKVFASLAKEAQQLKTHFLGLRKPKETLRTEFETIVQTVFVDKVPVSMEQCKSFVNGANFMANERGGVDPDKVFTRLELILGPLESDVAILRSKNEQMPPGFTPVALGLETERHAYTLLKTPTGAIHAFSNVKGLEEGYLGPKRVPSDIANAAFEKNIEPLFRHSQYRESCKPSIRHVVYVKDEYVDALTHSLDTFHDLPWFGNKCGALRAMTLALVMVRAKQIAEASTT